MGTSRATLSTLLRTYLGTAADDPFYSDTVVNATLQEAYDDLLSEILRANPSYLQKPVTLAADGAASHLYTLATQAVPIVDFAGWLEVRWTDTNGSLLRECRQDELRDAGVDYFSISGPDQSAVLETSVDSDAGVPLFFRYRFWPAAFSGDSDTPAALPERFQSVVALESVFAFGFGGEQRCPPELRERWITRKANLLAHVGRRGIQPSRTRLDPSQDPV